MKIEISKPAGLFADLGTWGAATAESWMLVYLTIAFVSAVVLIGPIYAIAKYAAPKVGGWSLFTLFLVVFGGVAWSLISVCSNGC